MAEMKKKWNQSFRRLYICQAKFDFHYKALGMLYDPWTRGLEEWQIESLNARFERWGNFAIDSPLRLKSP